MKTMDYKEDEPRWLWLLAALIWVFVLIAIVVLAGMLAHWLVWAAIYGWHNGGP